MDITLKSACNRKTRFRKSQRNTYGLLPGPSGSCPSATVGKGGCSSIPEGRKNPTCYVFNIMSAYKAVKPTLQHNTDAIKQATQAQRIQLLTKEFQRFQTSELKQPNPRLYYRLHWSGDIYDQDYADALVAAMNKFPKIKFWCYTRSFEYAPGMVDRTPNLNMYLSLDPVNLYLGLVVYYDWLATKPDRANMSICYMAEVDDFKVRFETARQFHEQRPASATDGHANWPKTPEFGPSGMVPCPQDKGLIPIERACDVCGRCVKRLPKPVWFPTK